MSDQEKNLPESAPQESASQEPAENLLPEPKVTIEDAGALRKRITVEIPRARVDAKFEEMFGELSRSAQVPGFRPGHAPRRLIEKRFGKEVLEDVRNSLVGEGMNKVMEDKSLQAIGEPDLKLDEITIPEGEDMKFSFEIEVAPQFELPDYKGIEITRPKLEITDKHVDEMLESYRQAHGKMVEVAAGIEDNDVVTADVRLSGEGIDHTHAGMEMRVAPAQVEGILLEDLPKAFSGKAAGQQVSLKSKVPAAHPTEAWRDKDVTVSFDIKQVRRLEMPAADDEFAKQAGFDNLAQMRAFLHARLEAQAAAEQHKAMQAQVAKFLGDKINIEIPQDMADRQSQRLLTRRVVDLMYRGVPREQIEENLEGLKAEAAQRAMVDLKRSFILDKLALAENIKVEDAEVNARVAQMARQSNRRPERYKQEMKADGTLDELTMALAEEKAMDKVLELAKVVDAPAAPAASEEAPKPKKAKAKTEAKSEAKSEAKAETKAETKAEAKSEGKSHAKAEAKSEAKPEAKPKAAKKAKPKE